jgi:hypothetical protein
MASSPRGNAPLPSLFLTGHSYLQTGKHKHTHLVTLPGLRKRRMHQPRSIFFLDTRPWRFQEQTHPTFRKVERVRPFKGIGLLQETILSNLTRESDGFLELATSKRLTLLVLRTRRLTVWTLRTQVEGSDYLILEHGHGHRPNYDQLDLGTHPEITQSLCLNIYPPTLTLCPNHPRSL